MTTCPVCEHVQQVGDECEVCGRKLAGAAPVAPFETLAGLEPTLYEPAAPAAGEAPASPLPGLEPTMYEAAATAAAEPSAAWIEATGSDAPGPVSADPVPGLEQHRAEAVPDVEELPREGPVICRYCRTPAMPNDRFCSRCGMRLSRFEPVKMALAEHGGMVCPDCGALGEGPRCRRCGGRMVGA
jgi:hypothetical protein